MGVDVVVVNYKTPELLYDFVRSYEENWFPGCKLIVVDVQPDKMFNSKYEHLYVATENNEGYGKACNLGASYGENDVILLANADTLLSNALETCYDNLIENEHWGVLGPRQVDEHNRITGGPMVASSLIQGGWHEPDNGQASMVYEEAVSVSGALYFIKRSVWNELTDCSAYQNYQPGVRGAFLETPHYYDETFCSYHARKHGYKVVYYGRVAMTHFWHKSSELGGWADQQVAVASKMFEDACTATGISC